MTDSAVGAIALSAGELQDDTLACRYEWLAANGIGGYASSTLGGANTRRYHGLLVAALQPPLGRAVLLSKLEESLEIIGADGAAMPAVQLGTNLYPGVMYPRGHRLLATWTSSPAPTWVWEPTPGVRLEKRIWMPEGRNAAYIGYRVLAAPLNAVVRLHLVPLVAWKGFHTEMKRCDTHPDVNWYPSEPAVQGNSESLRGTLHVDLPPIEGATPDPVRLSLCARTADGEPFHGTAFDETSYWYFQFQHPREQERGLDYEEDLLAIGRLSATLREGEEFFLVACADEDATPPAGEDWRRMAARAARAEAESKGDSTVAALLLAADQFLIDAPDVRATTIAGYPWFADWGRDTMISLPGLCLDTGRHALARDILTSYARFVSEGMLPNRFPDSGAGPEYNTVDAGLWYIAAIQRYVEVTGDTAALTAGGLLQVVHEMIAAHQAGTRYGIGVDPADGLLRAGEPGVQLTWMDAKVGDSVITPRTGKPVEINALWHNALAAAAWLSGRTGNAAEQARFEGLAASCAASFQRRFKREDGLGLWDVIDTPDGSTDGSVRPNQLFAISLRFPPLDPADEAAAAVVRVAREQLLTPVGLRTLSPADSRYCPVYAGGPVERDGAYHQGTVWPWLLGPMAEACAAVSGDPSEARSMLTGITRALAAYGMGSLPEVYDGGRPGLPEPQRPGGCIAQAWSVAETLRVWKKLSAADNG